MESIIAHKDIKLNAVRKQEHINESNMPLQLYTLAQLSELERNNVHYSTLMGADIDDYKFEGVKRQLDNSTDLGIPHNNIHTCEQQPEVRQRLKMAFSKHKVRDQVHLHEESYLPMITKLTMANDGKLWIHNADLTNNYNPKIQQAYVELYKNNKHNIIGMFINVCLRNHKGTQANIDGKQALIEKIEEAELYYKIVRYLGSTMMDEFYISKYPIGGTI